MRPKTTNSLMAYMRDQKGIHIAGSTQKRSLRNMGYFHGYKGYRYCRKPTNLLNYTDFSELKAVYDFDMKLKSLVYPIIMFLETALKSYALECLIAQSASEYFADIFALSLNDYKSLQAGSSSYRDAVKKRLSVREQVYREISDKYNSNIVRHYYDKDKAVPIWAIFELISLGEFNRLMSCANAQVRTSFSRSIGFNTSLDPDGNLPCYIVDVLRPLRNSVAHNNPIFDTRFKQAAKKKVVSYLESETGVRRLEFDCIVDYFILIAYMMSLFKCSKTEISAFLRGFELACNELYVAVPFNIFSSIIYTDTREKLRIFKSSL